MKKILSISFILLVGLFSTTRAQQKTTINAALNGYSNAVSFNKYIVEDKTLIIHYYFDFVKILWQTTEEVNTSYFELQRAKPNEEYVTIKKIKAGNITDGKTSYHVKFSKVKIGGERVNYRLKLVFKDGSSAVSEITAFDMLAPSGLKGFVMIAG